MLNWIKKIIGITNKPLVLEKKIEINVVEETITEKPEVKTKKSTPKPVEEAKAEKAKKRGRPAKKSS